MIGDHLEFEITVRLPNGNAKTGRAKRPLLQRSARSTDTGARFIMGNIERAINALRRDPNVLQVIPFLVSGSVAARVQIRGFKYTKLGYVGGSMQLVSVVKVSS